MQGWISSWKAGRRWLLAAGFWVGVFACAPSAGAYVCDLNSAGGTAPTQADAEILMVEVLENPLRCDFFDCDFDGDGQGPDVGDVSALLNMAQGRASAAACQPYPGNRAPVFVQEPPSVISATAGAAMSQSFVLRDPDADTVHLRAEGSLPAGVSLTGFTLSGAPTQHGQFAVTLVAHDAALETRREIVLAVAPPTPAAPLVLAAVKGEAFTHTFAEAAQPGAVVELDGVLPQGVSFDGAALLGVPAQQGDFPLTAAVSQGFVFYSYPLTLRVATRPVLGALPAVLSATVGVAFSQTLSASDDGAEALAFSLSGALPEGMGFTGEGLLSGTPAQAGSFPLQVGVSDGALASSAYVTLWVNGPPVWAAPPGQLTVNYGEPFSQTFSASDPNGDTLDLSVVGSLPPGVTFDAGVLGGSPLAVGEFALSFVASDGALQVQTPFVFTVPSRPPVLAFAAPLAQAVITQSQPLVQVTFDPGAPPLSPGQAVLLAGGEAVATFAQTQTGPWVAVFDRALSQGQQVLTALFSDGQNETSASVSVWVDSEAAVLSFSHEVAGGGPIYPGDGVVITLASGETGGVATAQILVGDTVTVTLHDDGQSPDGTAQDGIYTALWQTPVDFPTQQAVVVTGQFTDAPGNIAPPVSASVPLWAMPFGDLWGTVSLQVSGGGQGVTVTLSSSELAEGTMALSSSADGSFVFEGLRAGVYDLAATHPHFSQALSQGVTLSAGQGIALGQLVLLDTSPPQGVFTTVSPGQALSGVSPSLELVLQDAATGLDAATVQAWFDGAPVALTPSATPQVVTWQPVAPLPDGPHLWEVQGVDLAGNVGQWSLSFTVDTAVGILAVEEDTGGFTKTLGEVIHLRLNAGETGGVARVDVGAAITGLALRDDGTGGDPVAGDGWYERDLPINQPGLVATGAVVTGYFTDAAGNAAAPMSASAPVSFDGGGPACAYDVTQARQTCTLAAATPTQDRLELENLSNTPQTLLFEHNGKGFFQNNQQIVADVLVQGAANGWGSFGRSLWLYLINNKQHASPVTEQVWGHNPSLFLNSVGFGICDDAASVYRHLAAASGSQSRVWHLEGHVVPEFYEDGRWQMYDPDGEAYFVTPTWQTVGVEELAANPDYILHPPWQTGDPPPMMVTYADYFTTTQNNLVYDFYSYEEPDRPVSFTLPPQGKLTWGQVELSPLQVYQDQLTSGYSHLKLTLPAGFTGPVDTGLALHHLTGDATVRVNGLTFEAGSQALLDYLSTNRQAWISGFEAVDVRGELHALYLLNPKRFGVQASNQIVVSGADPLAIRAQVAGP